MQLACICIADRSVLVTLGDVRGRDGEFSRYLMKRVLAGGQSELVLEKGGFGRVFVGVGKVEALGRIQ